MGEIIARPIPPAPLPFTGERLTSDYHGQTEIEHLHRYLLAREWCRGKDVLDVASGEGYGTALLAQVARTAIGVEIDAEAVEHATRSYRAANLSYMTGDARSLPVADGICDIVVSFETIEHFGEQQIFLEEVHRVLRPGGLFIVSTPDRDNYSPADTPANPYHVRELTRAEFARLLRTRFEHVSTLLQRSIFGSAMFPAGSEGAAPMCFERRGSDHFEASLGLARPQYVLAFASDAGAALPPPSVYIETGRLGMLSPPEAEAELKSAQSMLDAEREHAEEEAERGRASAEEAQKRLQAECKAQFEAERDLLTAELKSAQSMLKAEREHAEEEAERGRAAAVEAQKRLQAECKAQLEGECASLTAELRQVIDELAGARGEARGLLAANEAAERACTALRDELRTAHANGARMQDRTRALEAELEGERNRASDCEARRALSETRLANTLASHSWRVTAPLRRISQMIYRRP